MKTSPLFASLAVLLIAPGIACLGRDKGGPAKESDSYFGQKPPGIKSELFAPGLVSTANLEHGRLVFSPDGTELFWAVVPVTTGQHDTEEQNIWHARMTNGRWSAPAKLLLPQPINRAPALSQDGTVLYYLSPDPRAGQGGGVPVEQLWEVKREAEGWGTPKLSELPLPKVPGKMVMSFCLAGNGDLYFDLGGPGAGGKWGWQVYVSSLKDGRFLEPTLLGNGINDGTINQGPFVPPDESYLIFSSNREGGIGAWDLYISFKGEDGRWGRPVNMGVSINSESQDRFPSVSPDGKYLFFARPNGDRMDDMFWVDAGIIGKLRGESRSK